MEHPKTAGASTPGSAAADQNDRAGGQPGATTHHHNVRRSIVPRSTSACNAQALPEPWPILQARATRAGWVAGLIETEEGRPMLVATRWARSITFEDLGKAESWLRLVEGKR